MKTSSTLLLSVLLCVGWSKDAVAEIVLWLEPAGRVLQPNASGQKVVVQLRNTGPEEVPVIGGTFQFQIADGLGSAQAPRLRAVRCLGLPGSPFTSQTVSEVPVRQDPGLWSLMLISPPEAPLTEFRLAPGSSFSFAEVEIDTTGIKSPGAGWSFRTQGTTEGDSFFDAFDPANRLDLIQVVPKGLSETLSLSSTVEEPPQLTWLMGEEGVVSLQAVLGEVTRWRLEWTSSLSAGTWQSLTGDPVRQGNAWRWDLVPDAAVSENFFRLVPVP